MLVLIYDDFRSDNEATVRRVLRFLDVDDSAALNPAWVNPTGVRRRGRVATFTKRLRDGRDPAPRRRGGCSTPSRPTASASR